MQPCSGTVCIVTNGVEPEWDAELNRWYDEEHLPNLLRVPGYYSGRRYTAVQGEPAYMAFYEIAGMDAYRSPEHAQAAETPWTARVRPHRLTPRIAFYQQTFPQEGIVQGPAWCDGTANEGGLLVVRTDVAPEHEPDFNAWYDEEHLYALCTVPGVIAARRFKAIEGEPRYMAIYHLEAPDVQASVAWKQAIDTPWSARARAAFRNPWRVVYQPRR